MKWLFSWLHNWDWHQGNTFLKACKWRHQPKKCVLHGCRPKKFNCVIVRMRQFMSLDNLFPNFCHNDFQNNSRAMLPHLFAAEPSWIKWESLFFLADLSLLPLSCILLHRHLMCHMDMCLLRVFWMISCAFFPSFLCCNEERAIKELLTMQGCHCLALCMVRG